MSGCSILTFLLKGLAVFEAHSLCWLHTLICRIVVMNVVHENLVKAMDSHFRKNNELETSRCSCGPWNPFIESRIITIDGSISLYFPTFTPFQLNVDNISDGSKRGFRDQYGTSRESYNLAEITKIHFAFLQAWNGKMEESKRTTVETRGRCYTTRSSGLLLV